MGQLVRSDGRGDGTPFDVVAVTETAVWLQQANSKAKPAPLSFDYVKLYFAAHPPQEQPDRLAEETDGWVPLVAYRKAFCPADDKELETGYRVVEAFAGALIDALFCGTCNRHFSADTLTEIKLWKD